MYALLKYCWANGCIVKTWRHGSKLHDEGHSDGEKISAFGLNELVIIHHVGKTNGTQRTSRTPYRKTLVLMLMEDPPLAHLPLQNGQGQDDQEEHHRERGAVTEGVELERLLVEV